MTSTAPTPTAEPRATGVVRIEVRPAPGRPDPRTDRILADTRATGWPMLAAVRTARVYLIEADLTPEQTERLATALLADPIIELPAIGVSPTPTGQAMIEVHPLPGIMDPAAQSVANAAAELLGLEAPPSASTGWRYEFEGVSDEDARAIAHRLLANTVVQGVHTEPHHPAELPHGSPAEFRLTRIPLRDLDDDSLLKLSRDAHLFLSLDEMRAIRDEYRTLEREPTDIELETLAQTWSEHCVHKTLKSTVRYQPPTDGYLIPGLDAPAEIKRPGVMFNTDGSVTIDNLLKSTVAAATFELIDEGLDWTRSVFVDNAGIIEFDEHHAVCIKVETHNHPSALEPYGGAATGIGGCIRDIMGTGLAAKPIANTDVFCVADPNYDPAQLPPGCLHPRRILTEVVAGVRDYGNRMGIPTLNGAVWFDNRHVGNPLVFAGCVGLVPNDKTHGDPRPGDLIVALGGRTGRDGIHGATFSSAELTDTHADEFSHAVQIGNAIEEKCTLDAILRARDAEATPLYTSITDCGAGGFSSAVGEMGEKLGATVHLDQAPLKYAGLTYTEIWISEAQERMVLAVPPENLDKLQAICDEEHVELAVLGTFGTEGADLVLNYRGTEVGRMPMAFLHDGIPTPTRQASWPPPAESRVVPAVARNPELSSAEPSITEALLKILSHPNVASKHWIVRQYDHEVQGATIVKPLVGPRGIGPGDASVIQPIGCNKAIAIGCGLATGIGDPSIGGDPYHMALAAVDECVRNLVCVGADPSRIAILDNFCWPSCHKPENLGALVRAAMGCYDAAKAYKTPFVSGKDSLHNQFTTQDGVTIEIPPTLLITGLGIVQDPSKCVTMDMKQADSVIVVVDANASEREYLGGSIYRRLFAVRSDERMPQTRLDATRLAAHAIHAAISAGLVRACHDASDGGPLTAIAEMLIAGSTPIQPLGVELGSTKVPVAFSERPGCYVLEVAADQSDAIIRLFQQHGVAAERYGETNNSGVLSIDTAAIGVEDLTAAWRQPLDW
ncbi:MAG: phosphoribosylformylglycinamidine synthase subunit PurS [Planctomycetota bacterium]